MVGTWLIDYCVLVNNSFFNNKSIHKYKSVYVGRDGTEGKIIIDFVLVKQEMPKFMMDVKSVRGLWWECQTILYQSL